MKAIAVLYLLQEVLAETRPSMKNLPLCLIVLCLFFSGCSSHATDTDGKALNATGAASATPNGPKAMPDVAAMIERLVTQDGCKDFSAEMRMTAQGESGRREQVDFRIQRKNDANRSATFLTVVAPKEDTDKAILAFEPADGPTEAFSYLSGLKKLARMNSARQLGFRGAKVTIQELLAMQLGQYTHDAGERTVVGEELLIKVEFKQKPDRNLAFPRIVGFFKEENQEPTRFDLYNEQDELQKQVAIVEIKSIQKYRTITGVAIDDLQQKLKLKLDTRKIEYDTGLAESLFTESRLKKHITSAGNRLIQ
jgi:hypothetical protein